MDDTCVTVMPQEPFVNFVFPLAGLMERFTMESKIIGARVTD